MTSKKKVDSAVDLKELLEQRKATIKVIGTGGAGNNTATRLLKSGITGVDVITANTDAQQLLYADASKKILIGKSLTKGLGAGADPSIGEEAAKESREEIKNDRVCLVGGGGEFVGKKSSKEVPQYTKEGSRQRREKLRQGESGQERRGEMERNRVRGGGA